MIDFTKFYDDLSFIYALFMENKLTIDDIRKISDKLVIEDGNDYLVNILISNDEEVSNSFENYFKDKNIIIENPKIEITKKIFSYILKGCISMKAGIDFVHYQISDQSKYKKYVGDDLGIEQILGNYFAIDDGDVADEKQIHELTQEIYKEMQEYIEKY